MWPFKPANTAEITAKADISTENRANSIQNPTIPVSSSDFLKFFGIDTPDLPVVTIDRAMTVPAVTAAVTFLSRTMASLPLNAYRKNKKGAAKLTGKLQMVVSGAPNYEMGSYKLRQYFWQQVFTGGRGMLWIERTPAGVEALWPLDPSTTVISRVGGKMTYTWSDKWTGKTIVYDGADVIDVPFFLRSDGVSHFGPIYLAAKAVQLAIAMNDYGSAFFAGGGVPPLALSGPLPAGPEAMNRALGDITRAIDNAKATGKPITPIPGGYELKPVGIDPAKGQMIEARRFQIEEVARAFQLPPVFLQDLTRATFSNAEQQDLHLVKHLVGQWAAAFEDEANLKIFGRTDGGRYIRHNLDGLLRGDFVSRMTGYATAVQNAIRTPDEIRDLEELPAKGGAADDLHIQSATVPIGSQQTKLSEPPVLVQQVKYMPENYEKRDEDA